MQFSLFFFFFLIVFILFLFKVSREIFEAIAFIDTRFVDWHIHRQPPNGWNRRTWTVPLEFHHAPVSNWLRGEWISGIFSQETPQVRPHWPFFFWRVLQHQHTRNHVIIFCLVSRERKMNEIQFHSCFFFFSCDTARFFVFLL